MLVSYIYIFFKQRLDNKTQSCCVLSFSDVQPAATTTVEEEVVVTNTVCISLVSLVCSEGMAELDIKD